MASTTNPKCGDYLRERIQKEGSWAKAKVEKQLNNLDATNETTTEMMKLEVAAAGGDPVMLVATKEGEVKFVHNITLAKTQEDFVLVGVTGMGHLATFLAIADDSIKGTFSPPNRRVGQVPGVEDIFGATSLATFKALRASNGEGGELTAGYKGGVFWSHPALWNIMPNRTIYCLLPLPMIDSFYLAG